MSTDPRPNPQPPDTPPVGPPDRRNRSRDDSEPVTRGELEEKFTYFRNSTIENVNARFQLLGDQILTKLDTLDNSIKSGFPGGDAAEHRKAHERQIKIEEERAELFKSIREKIITSGIWGLLVLLGLASWEFIKQSVK